MAALPASPRSARGQILPGVTSLTTTVELPPLGARTPALLPNTHPTLPERSLLQVEEKGKRGIKGLAHSRQRTASLITLVTAASPTA